MDIDAAKIVLKWKNDNQEQLPSECFSVLFASFQAGVQPFSVYRITLW